ncbi:uncharacterized protein LOC121379178 [Gigantopelta aegis]|uniref:uncharacterized protein LOC121379178 n=1 Tax=Gigantopelta aegis TaxID=1735272 RepID=UPI001B88B8D8|nr:uncharacterized protein LOC121379178 [Gigantopelta aegis]
MISLAAAGLACYKHGRVTARLVRMRFRTLRMGVRQLQTSAVALTKADIDEETVPFKNTKAASWKSTNSVIPAREVPVYQPVIIGISVMVFLVYFLILREESDIDSEFRGSLFDRVPGLEETQLKLSIEYNTKLGKDVTELEMRLAEIVGSK